MIIFKVQTEDIKVFMNKLYKEDTFEMFEVRSFSVSTYIKYSIDGFIDQSLMPSERKYATWKDIRPFALSSIKGSIRPKSIKIQFSLKPTEVPDISANCDAVLLNMIYENDEILLTTSTLQKQFALDKSDEQIWSEYSAKLLEQKGIIFLKEDI